MNILININKKDNSIELMGLKLTPNDAKELAETIKFAAQQLEANR